MKNLTFKHFFISLLVVLLFVVKLHINNFLMAENGDTYDFFKISFQISQGNFFYESKRLPLYSLLLAPFNSEDYVFYGRIINNLIYFLSVFFFYKLISYKFKLELVEKILFTGIFAFNFVIFDNSFFILSDSLLLLLAILFLYLYEKNYSIFLLTIIGSLAFYTRFEGALLIGSLVLLKLFQKKYIEIIKISILFLLLAIPLLLRLYLTSQSDANYLEDQAGFILSTKNILKAFGSLFFATGGFWLLGVYLSDKNNQNLIQKPKELIKYLSTNIYEILFILFSVLLILWGFYIRLYTVPIMICILYYIRFLKSDIKISMVWLSAIPMLFFIYNVQVLDHFDLGFYKYSKVLAVILSLVILIVISYKKLNIRPKIYITSVLIILLNLFIFFEKFFATNYKYYTIVQASEFALKNNLQNVAYFDESGVQKWYFKDFDSKYNYFLSRESLTNWLIQNQINYLMISDEMGYKMGQIDKAKKDIEKLEIVAEFNSNYSGGRTVIYKLENHRIKQQ